MKKCLVSIIMCSLMVLGLFTFQANAESTFPGSLEAPRNIRVIVSPLEDKVYIDDYTINFSIPKSISSIPEKWESWKESNSAEELTISLEYDYKYNESGSWHYTSGWDQPDGTDYSFGIVDLGTNGRAYVRSSVLPDIPEKMSMLDNNTVYFRCRFAVSYEDTNNNKTIKTVSPWSETTAIGKNTSNAKINIVPPVLTGAVIKKDDLGAPFFEITNQIPESIKALDNTEGSISIGIEYRINGGEWKTRDSYDRLQEVLALRPENTGAGDDINIEAATYEIRSHFGYGPVYGIVNTWSNYSNIIKVVSPKFDLKRLSGQTRIQTAISISKEGWQNSASTVILTRDDNYPDALTGTPLSKKLNAPILFTDTKVLTPDTEAEINRLNPSKVIILGGTGAVSQNIENILKQKYEIQRIGGADRYETSAKIAKELGFKGKAVITTGEDFHSALIVSPVAAYKNIPILLTLPDILPSYTKEALQFVSPSEAIVVGSTSEVSDKVASSLTNVKRIKGSDIYQESVVTADEFQADMSTIFFATGKDFPDALTGSALAAKNNSPILFVNDPLSTYVTQYLGENKTKIKSIRLLGGNGVISENTSNAINQILDQK